MDVKQKILKIIGHMLPPELAYIKADQIIELFDDRWISVKDKPPQPYSEFIAYIKTFKCDFVGQVRYDTSLVPESQIAYEAHDLFFSLNDIVCWMPLPERPK